MTWFWIILFVFVGLTLIALEVVAIPGTTVVGFAGLAMLIFAIWSTYSAYGSTAGHLVLGSSLLFGVLILTFFLRSKTWKKVKLNDVIDSRVNTIDESKIVEGAEGETISRLAPSGKALINGEIVEVHTFSEFVDPETKIKVVKVEGNKIIVEVISND